MIILLCRTFLVSEEMEKKEEKKSKLPSQFRHVCYQVTQFFPYQFNIYTHKVILGGNRTLKKPVIQKL